jgi:hypothetical protein
MIDLIGAIVLSTLCATVIGTLVGLSPVRGTPKPLAFIGAGLWAGIIVATAALGGFAPGAAGSVPAVAFPFFLLLAAGLGAWAFLPAFRSALMSIPLPALIGLNAGRILGIFFIMLYAAGRLPAPFAPVAGWGDVAVGALAIPLAALAAAGAVRPQWLRIWNALGALDLVTAVSLGLLSAPGTPFQVFRDEPGTTAMGLLPWIMIPAILVPIYLVVHVTIAAKIRSHSPERRMAAA